MNLHSTNELSSRTPASTTDVVRYLKLKTAAVSQRDVPIIALVNSLWGRCDDEHSFEPPALGNVTDHDLTDAIGPGGTPEQHQWFKDLQRVTISVENAIRLARMFGEIDVAELLPRVAAPTLVLHSRHDARVHSSRGC